MAKPTNKLESEEFAKKNARLVENLKAKSLELKRQEAQEPILQEHLAQVGHLPVLEGWLAYQELENNFQRICSLRQELPVLQKTLLLKRKAFAQKKRKKKKTRLGN